MNNDDQYNYYDHDHLIIMIVSYDMVIIIQYDY